MHFLHKLVRTVLAAMTAAALIAGPAAATSTDTTVHVASVLARRIESVKGHDGGIAVLVPTTMPLGSPVYTASHAGNGSYTLEIDAAPNCDEANVCLSALFLAQRGGHPFGSRVTLAHRTRGYFANIQCGASCSPASIEWVRRSVLYTIQANPSIEANPGTTAAQLKTVFIAAADQAIDAGPR